MHYAFVLFQYKNIVRLARPIKTKPYYLILSHQFYHKDPKLAEKIWNTITQLRIKTKEWQSLKQKYYQMKTWKEGGYYL